MQARSALFDLYGDHLLSRGGVATVSCLVRCLGALEIAPPAVRTAVSRMVRQDWLTPVHVDAAAGYAVTPQAVSRLEQASARIYRTGDDIWDGRWHLLVVPRSADRSGRNRLAAGLRYLGYGAVDATTWLAARPSSELDALLRAEGVVAQRFTAEHDGDTAAMVRTIWDLDALAAAYNAWHDEAVLLVEAVTPAASDEAAFAARSELVHTWRKFLFIDPRLPDELLPADWAGRRAARYFDEQAARLLPATARFIDSCRNGNGRRPSP